MKVIPNAGKYEVISSVWYIGNYEKEGIMSVAIRISPRPSDPILKVPEPSKTGTVTKVALGCVAFALGTPIVALLEKSVTGIMAHFNIKISESQEIIQIWNGISNLAFPLLTLVLKVALLAYIIFIGPVLEERLFRGSLHSWLEKSSDNSAARILANGFLFGAAHLSPFQGWANVPIFAVTSFGGCGLAALREQTGDITASTTAHILHNGAAMLAFLTS
jgi:membrane protease YdiL (CAAX protease family)